MADEDKLAPRRAASHGESRGHDYSTIYRAASAATPGRALEEDTDDTVIRTRDRLETRDARDDFDEQVGPHADANHTGRPGWAALLGSIGLTILSTVLPGAGLLGARSRSAKLLGAVVALAFVGGVLWLVAQARGGVAAASKLLRPDDLGKVIAALIIIGLIWVTMIAGTQLLTRPRGLTVGKKALGATVVTVCSLLIATPLALAARYSFDTQKLVSTVFDKEEDVKSTSRPTIDGKQPDPWQDHPRLNILLIGSDGNAARQEQDPDNYSLATVRTDTMMVASINTATGATTIVQVPRNLQYAPFPEGSAMAGLYPRGFRGEGDPATFFLNALWEKAESVDYPQVAAQFAGNTYPGAELLKQGIQGVTGLKVDYFAMLNTDGLQRLIDAMGGVTVNINEPLPKGNAQYCGESNREKCLWPGPDQHLGGYDAMWYARSRKTTTDYNRMERQSCLVNAVIDQANPATMLTSYEAIASAAGDMVVTDIPQEIVEPIVGLSAKVKDATVSRLVFAPGQNGYEYANPDFDTMRAAVAAAIAADSGTQPPAASTPPATPATPATTPTMTTKPTNPVPTATPTSGTQTVADACAYNLVQPGEEDDEG